MTEQLPPGQTDGQTDKIGNIMDWFRGLFFRPTTQYYEAHFTQKPSFGEGAEDEIYTDFTTGFEVFFDDD